MQEVPAQRTGSAPVTRLGRIGLAKAREEFLGSRPGRQDLSLASVREPIVKSWQRSWELKVEPDNIRLPYIKDPNLESPLTVSAGPILRQLADQLADQSVSILLTDSQGMVLQRETTGSTLLRQLDRVNLAPGFSYAEEFVGTNGIGTTLEARVPTLVSGHEHYAEHLEQLVCAGAPIHHPITGVLLGVLDLTTWAKESGSLLMVLATTTAKSIEQSLFERAGMGELSLFRDYMTTCQHSGGVVMAISDDLVMMNHHARQNLEPADQAALLGRSADAKGASKPVTLLADLPSGLLARMQYQPSFCQSSLVGGVFRIQLNSAVPRIGSRMIASSALAGVVGSEAGWQRCCQEIETFYRNGDWVALEGEAGVGKLALARAVHQHHNPTGRLVVFDAELGPDSIDLNSSGLSTVGEEEWLDEVAEALAENRGTVVLQHVDQLSAGSMAGLAALLETASVQGADSEQWVVITLRSDRRNTDVDAQLLPHFPHTIELPALRHHIEDVRKLVPFLLRRISRSTDLTCSPEAMRQLMRLPWLGNIEQLRGVLAEVVRHRRSGVISLEDLPAQCRSVSRRQLTQLEALERDAIVNSLVAHDGSKEKAAAALGMSRASIYRKIRGYGITSPMANE